MPPWVQLELTKELSQTVVPRNEEFNFIRLSLVAKQKQARKMVKFQDNKKNKNELCPKNKGSTNVADTNSNVAAAQMPPSQGGVTLATGGFSQSHTAPTQSYPKNFQQKSWKCGVPGCTYKARHGFNDCKAFKNLDADQKGQIVLDKKLCVLCFGGTHVVSGCPKKTIWKPCNINNCNKWHSRYLHGATTAGLVLALPEVKCMEQQQPDVFLLIQDIEVPGGGTCVTFWDHGSTTALVTYDFEEKQSLIGEECSFELSGVGDKTDTFRTKMYVIDLVDKEGREHSINAFGIDKITSAVVNNNIKQFVKEFEELSEPDIAPPSGNVDLLIGLANVDIMPTKTKVRGQLALFESSFGTGWLIGGSPGVGVVEDNSIDSRAHIVSHSDSKHVQMDFLSAEAFGVDIPKRCNSCKACKECRYAVTQLTYEEQKELSCIESLLSYDATLKKWTAAYPYKVDPEVLNNNYRQAYGRSDNMVPGTGT